MRTVMVLALLTCAVLAGCSGSAQTSSFRKPGVVVDLSAPAVVLSDQMGMSQDMPFLDILSTQLLGKGMNLMDRSTLRGILKEKGLNWNDIVSGQQYFQIGTASPVKTIIIVNAQMMGQMVAKATCRVLDATSGTMLMSMNVTNPAPYQPMYLGNKSTARIAEEWAEEITGH
jgi:hypothetical protein